MTAKSLEAQMRHWPGAAIIDLHGEIDAFAEVSLNAAYAEAEDQGVDVILLNFTDVAYINSTGIALIVGLLARARKAHRRLLVTLLIRVNRQNQRLLAYGSSEHYRTIFEITRLSDAIRMYNTEAEAIAAAEAA